VGGMIPTAAVITRCTQKSNGYPAPSERARCGSTGIIPATLGFFFNILLA